MTNKLNYLIEFLGKAIWGGLVLSVSAFLFAFLSVIVSTRVHDERMTIITAFLIVAPFTAIVSLMGFNKIKQKVEEPEFSARMMKSHFAFNIKIITIINAHLVTLLLCLCALYYISINTAPGLPLLISQLVILTIFSVILIIIVGVANHIFYSPPHGGGELIVKNILKSYEITAAGGNSIKFLIMEYNYHKDDLSDQGGVNAKSANRVDRTESVKGKPLNHDDTKKIE